MTMIRTLLATAMLPALLAPAVRAADPAPRPPPPEVLRQAYLCEIVRHLYRWHLDESDVERLVDAKTFPFWVRRLEPQLDAGDRSEFAEIVLPLVDARVKVKRPDYRIEESGVTVTGRTFRIVNVARGDLPPAPGAADVVVEADYAALRAYLFETRMKSEFPDDALQERLRRALRRQLGQDEATRDAGEQVVHIAPLSPVANECWVYWENQKHLIRFASDIELANPAVWDQEALTVRTWDVMNQVVVSLDEAAGSNAFMTRDQIGRALFNCVVLGKRLSVQNPAPPAAPPAARSAQP
jgi:hypothetical protein